MPEWAWYALLIPAGFVAGVVNTIAGGGSFLTLPALMFVCGMEPKIANGTNRVAILLSSASAAATFHRHGHLDKKLALRLSIPTLLGVPIGASTPTQLSPTILGCPTSAIVGTFGRATARDLPVTASARTLPLLICCNPAAREVKQIGVCPPTADTTDGPAPW